MNLNNVKDEIKGAMESCTRILDRKDLPPEIKIKYEAQLSAFNESLQWIEQIDENPFSKEEVQSIVKEVLIRASEEAKLNGSQGYYMSINKESITGIQVDDLIVKK